MPARNPTGFDINQLKAAASPNSIWAKRDPWARKYDRFPVSDNRLVSCTAILTIE